MRIVCGLAQQSEGNYTLFGMSNGAAARNNMGMLIEKPGIYEHLTALENLRYFSLMFGIQSQDHHRILEMVGLQNAGKKKARQFSLGMKQRLGIAQAMMEQPELLILDEPFNGLDSDGVATIRQVIKGLREKQATILLTSHYSEDITALCDTVTHLDGGKITATHSG